MVALSWFKSVNAIMFADALVAPAPIDHYVRYVTFLAVGDRTYTCDPANETSLYTLKSFDYDMFDAETDPDRKLNLGKHVLMLQRDSEGGFSVFYTANNTFTYWYTLKPFGIFSKMDYIADFILQGWQNNDVDSRSTGYESFGSPLGTGTQN